MYVVVDKGVQVYTIIQIKFNCVLWEKLTKISVTSRTNSYITNRCAWMSSPNNGQIMKLNFTM